VRGYKKEKNLLDLVPEEEQSYILFFLGAWERMGHQLGLSPLRFLFYRFKKWSRSLFSKGKGKQRDSSGRRVLSKAKRSKAKQSKQPSVSLGRHPVPSVRPCVSVLSVGRS